MYKYKKRKSSDILGNGLGIIFGTEAKANSITENIKGKVVGRKLV